MNVLRKLREKFGISAPKMAVRIKLPWYWRGAETVVGVILILALAFWAFQLGREFADLMASDVGLFAGGSDQEIPQDPRETSRLLQMERATREYLARQVKLLDEENSKLKEDLAFFQTLMPAGSKEGVSITQLKLQRDGLAGDYRYRLFLVQTGNRQREFKGSVEFVVNFQDGGVNKTMVLPTVEGAESNRVSFKFYQRIEGSFRVSPDTVVNSVEVRVFESGVEGPRTTQSVSLS
ncbi:MAG: DUF6776 family protein [Burkholderiales bacterium]